MLRAAPVVLTFAVLLVACATPPPPPQPEPAPLPRFEGPRAPAPGQARLYVFRPKFEDQALLDEQPVLQIGHAAITPLPQSTFAELQFPPGRHTLSLRPPEGGSDLWRTSLMLQLGRDSVTYLAIWMDEGFEPPAARADGAEPVLIVLPVGDPAETSARLRVERMDSSTAQGVLPRCCGRIYPPPEPAAKPLVR